MGQGGMPVQLLIIAAPALSGWWAPILSFVQFEPLANPTRSLALHWSPSTWAKVGWNHAVTDSDAARPATCFERSRTRWGRGRDTRRGRRTAGRAFASGGAPCAGGGCALWLTDTAHGFCRTVLRSIWSGRLPRGHTLHTTPPGGPSEERLSAHRGPWLRPLPIHEPRVPQSAVLSGRLKPINRRVLQHVRPQLCRWSMSLQPLRHTAHHLHPPLELQGEILMQRT